MFRSCTWLLFIGGFVLLPVRADQGEPGKPGSPPAQAEKPPARTDRRGDPLPPGAVTRLGTVRWRPDADVGAIAYFPDGKTLVTGGYDQYAEVGRAALWDVATGKRLREFKTGKRIVQALAVAPDGKISALGTDGQRNQENATASLWDLATGEERHRFGGHTEMVWAAALTPDGKVAATACSRAIRLWDTATGKEVRQFKEPRTLSATLTFSPDGKLLASGEGTVNTGDPIDVFVQLWDVATGKVVRTFTGHKDAVFSLVFSPDGKTLASAGAGSLRDGSGVLLFWDVASGKERRRVENPPAYPRAYSPDGKTLALVGANQIVFWDAVSGKERSQPADGSAAVGPVAFSPDGTGLATGGTGAILLWDVRTGERLHQLPGSHRSVAFSRDGKTLASPNEQGQVSLWEVATGKERRRFPAPPGDKEGGLLIPPYCRCVALVHGGDVLAASYGRTVYLWDAATGKELRRLVPEDNSAFFDSLASSPDGKLLAAGSGSGTGTYLWDVATGKRLHRLAREKEIPRTFTVAFSPDGKTLACALGTHKVRFWDVATGKEIKTLEWPNPDGSDSHFWIAYSPAGGMIAAAGRDENVYLWDIATGKELGRFVGHKGRVDSVAFSPDGKRLATAGTDTTVLIWDVGEALRKARP